MRIVFDKSTYKPGEKISGSATSGELFIYKLSDLVHSTPIVGEFSLAPLPAGSYSVELRTITGSIWSAIEVIANPWQRIRYGFLSEFHNQLDTSRQVAWAKKLHLTAIQFYDWAYKHETLIAPTDNYLDPLGGEITKSKLQELIFAYEAAGIYPSGYAAVYAVDREGWQRWSDSGLYSRDGKPFQLGEDFLWILDPADQKWLTHFINELKRAREFGFKTFHLDQYGWPKLAYKKGMRDGAAIELSVQFTTMLNKIIAEMPDTYFIFNNVNDFPTWASAQTKQNASYIEVWDPHSEYRDLAELIDKARSYDPDKPVILSAYLKPFGGNNIEAANASLELALATISSRGASHLITGGDGRVLYDPYYVRNHRAADNTLAILENYFNFITAAGDLLFNPERIDITRTHALGINTELIIISEDSITANYLPDNLNISIFDSDAGCTLHILNFLGQDNSIWDRPKNPIDRSSRVKISILSAGFSEEWHIGRADQSSKFTKMNAKTVADKFILDIVITGAWTIIHIPKF